MAAVVVTEQQKRTVACPKCKRGAGKPCRQIGTGGAIARDLDTAHRERRAAYLATPPVDTRSPSQKRADAPIEARAAASKCTGVDDAALASRAADLHASVGGKLLPAPAAELPDECRADAVLVGDSVLFGSITWRKVTRIARDGDAVHFFVLERELPYRRFAEEMCIVRRAPAMHPRPIHYIRAWTAIEADETPLCGIPIEQCFMDRTTIGTTHDTAGAPMPICPKCAKLARR